MICPRCQTENPDTARFCMNCGLSLKQRCSNCEAELPPSARFCMDCGQPVLTITPVDERRLARLAAATPEPLAEKVRAAVQLTGEQRNVTALLVDVVGSTALAEQLDTETWTAMINGVFDLVAPFIFRYEGTIARLLGDSLLAFFGASVAHEDDPVRAVRAAMELITAAQEYAPSMQELHGVNFALRACIHTGPVLLGPVDEHLKYNYTSIGGAVNLVSRLKFAAPPMSVLVSEETYRFIQPMFDFDELSPVEVKGRQRPVRVFSVLKQKAQPGSLRGLAGLESPMVGRDIELSALVNLCDALRAGLGRAVLLIGEPGLGKSRLIAEWRLATQKHFTDSSTGETSLWTQGHCVSYGQNLPYHLLSDWLHSVVGVSEGAAEAEARTALIGFLQQHFAEQSGELYPFLAQLMSIHLEQPELQKVKQWDPQALQGQYLEALRKLLRKLTSRQPLVVVLEDLHWADPSSTEIITKLLPLISELPLLLCLVTRPELDSPGWRLVTNARNSLRGSLSEITLHPLSDSDSRLLVANLLEIEALPEQLRTSILKKAEGNPFFVEEVIRMLIDRGTIVHSGNGWVAGRDIYEVEIPDNLQGLLMARIDRLPEETKETLRVAAVIGRQFPVKVLAEVISRWGDAT